MCVSVSVCVCVSATRLEVGVYFVRESVVAPALVLRVVGSYQSIGWQGSIGLIGFILAEDGSLVVEVIY